MLQQSDDHWLYYLSNVSSFTPLALVLGIAILTSLMTSIENETKAWKQLLSLPVSKWSVYLFEVHGVDRAPAESFIALAIASLALGLALDLDGKIPYVALLEYSFYPFFASLPLLALHLWLAAVIEHQGS